jgi:cell wall assembly regulator SMI1
MSDIVWKYIKPLENDTAIEEFEKTCGLEFPADLKECVKMNNGGRLTVNIFDTKETQERIMGSLLSFNKSDLDNIYSVFSILQKEAKNFLPFARDPAGNFLCVLHGKIVFWLHETNTYEYVAESFTELLEKLYI